MKISSFERLVPARWYRKTNEVIESLKQYLSAKIPRIAIITSKVNTKNEVQGNEDPNYEKDENSEKTTDPTEGKGKGKGKGTGRSSNREPKSSIEL